MSIVISGLFSCDSEPNGPESDCQLHSTYALDYGFLKASRAFDVRQDPPLEIKNGTLEYDLGYQWWFQNDDVPVPYPYSEYFIDQISFIDELTAAVKFNDLNDLRIYQVERNDCQMELTSIHGNLHLELTEAGDEISENRFAIYDHSSRRVTTDMLSFISDTFSFIEFRLDHFASFEEVIRQFALENPGKYDTIGIEQVVSKTKE
jgi:hypothetical protein